MSVMLTKELTLEQQLQELRRENQRLVKENELLSQYVEPEVLESLAKGEEAYLQLGGSFAEVSVMFIDIRNFTPMAESQEPDTVVQILNQFLDNITSTIVANKGVLDKIIGDAVMCFWAEPFTPDDFVYLSVKTALEILENMNPMVESIEEKYGQKIAIGMGIQSGRAVVGNIGSQHRLDFTVIGDVVNTAARLESQAKDGNAILIGEEVYKEVHNRISSRKIEGGLQLKGKDKPVSAYVVTGLAPDIAT